MYGFIIYKYSLLKIHIKKVTYKEVLTPYLPSGTLLFNS